MTLAELEANALDTDGDGIPNYRDNDDDGDGTLTIDEENTTTQDNNPTNDVTDPNAGPDYLNDQVTTPLLATSYRQHTIYNTFEVRMIAYGLDFSSFQYQTYDFGILINAENVNLSSTRNITPEF